eukprot:1374675-Pyramimonas_sp.AAC.1
MEHTRRYDNDVFRGKERSEIPSSERHFTISRVPLSLEVRVRRRRWRRNIGADGGRRKETGGNGKEQEGSIEERGRGE